MGAGRRLFKEYKIGDWHENYHDHYFIQIWARVDDNDNVKRFDLTYHSPAFDITDSARDYANAMELYDERIKIIEKNNSKRLVNHFKKTELSVIYEKTHDIEKMIADYEQLKKEFVNLYTKQHTGISRDYAKHLFSHCTQSVIEEVFKGE